MSVASAKIIANKKLPERAANATTMTARGHHGTRTTRTTSTAIAMRLFPYLNIAKFEWINGQARIDTEQRLLLAPLDARYARKKRASDAGELNIIARRDVGICRHLRNERAATLSYKRYWSAGDGRGGGKKKSVIFLSRRGKQCNARFAASYLRYAAY